MMIWSPELWREATVFNAQFEWFAIIGAPLDVSVIIILATLTFLLRHQRRAFRLALGATILYAAALATWFAWVAPANSVLATWTRGLVPNAFLAIRDRWETGHMVVAAFKFIGFVAVICALMSTSASPGNRVWPASPPR